MSVALIRNFAAALFLSSLLLAPAVRAQDAGALAAAVPVEVPQVLSGGFWEADGKSGPYRAIVVSDGGPEVATQVYVQWIAIAEGQAKPEVVKSVAVKEVAEMKFSNAFVFMQGERKGEVTLIVTSYDPEKDEDTQVWLKAGGPGTYKIVPPEPGDDEKENQ